MEELIGKSLEEYRIETWFELRLATGETGHRVAGYFTDSHLAAASGKGKGWYGSSGSVEKALVLTKDGKTGFLVGHSPVAGIKLSDEASLRDAATAHARSKLSEHELVLLGLTQP